MMHTYENNTPQAWDDIRNHEALFESFASMYLREHPGDMLRLKREHTYKVLAHARAIVAQEGLASQEGRAALLAAIYHDTGRFPQYCLLYTSLVSITMLKKMLYKNDFPVTL